MSVRSCRVCGCSDLDACIEPDGFPCCWVESDLCSACAFFAQGDGVVLLEAEEFSGKEVTSAASTGIMGPYSLHERENPSDTTTGAA
ncbi:MAG: hypothetical protein OXL36_08995 [Bryobacterales bacterium]|nr:hypothetical protein [Bryobacterales bacterium]MDE0293027.1 hypothetical protein [Bryobacterales bacterium]